MTSRLPGFYKLSVEQRIERLKQTVGLSPAEEQALLPGNGLSLQRADQMVENAIGVMTLPMGLATNFRINGRDYLVPMAVEEPSIIASASNMARIVRQAGGFVASATARHMIGQVQVVDCQDFLTARQSLIDNQNSLLAIANASQPNMRRRGGGAVSLEVRHLNAESDRQWPEMLVVQVVIDTRDAMGANVIDTMMEAIAPEVERLSKGTVYLRILSNYTDQCLARAECNIPCDYLATEELSGREVRDRIVAAYAFAQSDVYRAVTHNKGVMNGVDAVVVATGNDWRAIEAGAHAYAARKGHYGSMSEWGVGPEGQLRGVLELPMPVGIVGGAIGVNPTVNVAHKILHVQDAAELAQVVVAVGLAQNLGALRALVTEGIQKGHMALHARARAPKVLETPHSS